MTGVTIRSLATNIRKFLDEDWDFIVAVSGETGVGKSSLSCEEGLELDPLYSYKSRNVYSKSELTRLLWEVPPKSFINIDEAINILYRRDFAKGNQKNLLRDLDVVRDRNLCMFFLIPTFWDLDTKILNSKRIKLWIYVDKRGVAYLFKPDKNPFNPDPWNIRLNFKLMRNWGKGAHPFRSPNYVGTLTFPPMLDEEYRKYKEVKLYKKRQAQLELEEEEKTRKGSWKEARDKLIWYLHKVKHVNQKKIAELIGYTQPSIHLIIKDYIRTHPDQEEEADQDEHNITSGL